MCKNISISVDNIYDLKLQTRVQESCKSKTITNDIRKREIPRSVSTRAHSFKTPRRVW